MSTPPELQKEDCTFLYFKPGGKWVAEGRGFFPRNPNPGKYYEVDRAAILRENDGTSPGLARGVSTDEFVIIVIPDDDCPEPASYPRMLKEIGD